METNNTYIGLIPKSDNANNLKNFRLIGLCNTIYKIVTKIIANRLKPFLKDLISPFQSSFIKGRRTCDNAIIIQEIMNQFKKRKGKKYSMMLKLDLEKPFGRLEWSFIY